MLLRSFDLNRSNQKETETLKEINSEASLAIEEARGISYNLRPFQLDRLGLNKAIEGLIRSVSAASAIRFSTELDDINDLFSEDLRINFYRIVQESLNNIMKHAQEALRLIREHKPDVAVLDIDMPKLDGLGVAREVSKLSLGTRIIFLTLHKDADLFRAAIQAGASGYLLKDSAMQELVSGVKAVALGQQFVSAALVSLSVEAPEKRPRSPQDDLLASLTPTEREILKLIANGKSSKEIGGDLSIHYRTVENHRTNICKKLGIEGANALLRYALQHKLDG